MQVNLQTLYISTNEIEEVTGLDFSDNLAISLYQAIVFKDSRQFSSILFIEFCLFGLLWILFLPISLIALRNTGHLPDRLSTTIPVFLLLTGLVILLFLLWNQHLWKQAKRLKSLAYLLREGDRFNQILQTIHLIDQSQACLSADSADEREQLRAEAIAILQSTKDNLMRSLQAETLIRKSPALFLTDHDLLVMLETTLTKLMPLGIDLDRSAYSLVFNDVLQINLNIQQVLTTLPRTRR